jgi:hypothetical protein
VDERQQQKRASPANVRWKSDRQPARLAPHSPAASFTTPATQPNRKLSFKPGRRCRKQAERVRACVRGGGGGGGRFW